MFSVCDKESARRAYDVISTFAPMCKKDGAVQQLIEELKRDVRKWAKETAVDVGMGFMVERRGIKGDFDGCLELISIPEVFDTMESADMFFRDFLYMDSPRSMYDCTGQAFTSWYKLFKRNGRFFAYHRISMDV